MNSTEVNEVTEEATDNTELPESDGSISADNEDGYDSDDDSDDDSDQDNEGVYA